MHSKFNISYTLGIILLIALAGLLLFCARLSQVTRNTSVCVYGIDFIAFHTAARLTSQGSVRDIYVSTGEDFSGVDAGKFNQTARSSGFEYNPTRYVYLPVFIAPFQLLGHYNFPDAAKYWFIINLFLLLSIMFLQWRLIKGYFPPTWGAMAVLAMNMMSFPIFYSLKLGQTTLVICFAVCLMYYFAFKKKGKKTNM